MLEQLFLNNNELTGGVTALFGAREEGAGHGVPEAAKGVWQGGVARKRDCELIAGGGRKGSGSGVGRGGGGGGGGKGGGGERGPAAVSLATSLRQLNLSFNGSCSSATRLWLRCRAVPPVPSPRCRRPCAVASTSSPRPSHQLQSPRHHPRHHQPVVHRPSTLTPRPCPLLLVLLASFSRVDWRCRRRGR